MRMPGVITVPDFIRETREDYTSPTTSTFVNRIPQCRETVNRIDEVRICKRVNLLHQRGDHPIPVSRSEWVSERHKLYNIWACPTACQQDSRIAHRQPQLTHKPGFSLSHRKHAITMFILDIHYQLPTLTQC